MIASPRTLFFLYSALPLRSRIYPIEFLLETSPTDHAAYPSCCYAANGFWFEWLTETSTRKSRISRRSLNSGWFQLCLFPRMIDPLPMAISSFIEWNLFLNLCGLSSPLWSSCGKSSFFPSCSRRDGFCPSYSCRGGCFSWSIHIPLERVHAFSFS